MVLPEPAPAAACAPADDVDVSSAAVQEIAREIGAQAMDVLESIVSSDVFKTRMKNAMAPLVTSLVDAATTHDAEIRTRVNKLLKPYSDQYVYVLYAGASVAVSMIVLLVIMVALLLSVRLKFAATNELMSRTR
jgi:hypothetical protein